MSVFCFCRKSLCFCRLITLWGQQRYFTLIFLREKLEKASLFMKGTDKHLKNCSFLSFMSWYGIASQINILHSNIFCFFIKKHITVSSIFLLFITNVTIFQFFFSTCKYKQNCQVQLKQAQGRMFENLTLQANYFASLKQQIKTRTWLYMETSNMAHLWLWFLINIFCSIF